MSDLTEHRLFEVAPTSDDVEVVAEDENAGVEGFDSATVAASIAKAVEANDRFREQHGLGVRSERYYLPTDNEIDSGAFRRTQHRRESGPKASTASGEAPVTETNTDDNATEVERPTSRTPIQTGAPGGFRRHPGVAEKMEEAATGDVDLSEMTPRQRTRYLTGL